MNDIIVRKPKQSINRYTALKPRSATTATPRRQTRAPLNRNPVRVSPRRQPAPLPKKSNKQLMVVAMVAVTVALLGLVTLLPNKNQGVKSLSVSQQPPEPEKIKPVDMTVMKSEIQAAISAQPGLEIGVAIYDIKGDTLEVVGEDAAFLGASVSKVITATYYLHKVDNGQATLDEPIGGIAAREQLRKLIINSDNNAWKLLNDRVNRDEMLGYTRSIGLKNYSPVDNIISAPDVALLMKKLYADNLLSDGSQKYLLELLQAKKTNQYIANAVPAPAKVYHKAGWLDDRAHDAAIIDNGTRPYVLVVFSKSNTPSYPAKSLGIFKTITESASRTFNTL